jgi:hypothetical protein
MRSFPPRRPRPSSRVPLRRRCRPGLEGPETRQVPSTVTVAPATDDGGANGRNGPQVGATSGDLRWCVAPATATHSATPETINFDPTVFAGPRTITLDPAPGTLTLQDKHPLTVLGPSGGTATASGGDAVGILDLTSGSVTIDGVNSSHGDTTVAGAGIDEEGGTPTCNGCVFDHDAASVDPGSPGGRLDTAAGTTRLTGCTSIHDSGGGGVDANGAGTLKDRDITADSAAGVGAGGLYTGPNATVTATGCNISDDDCQPSSRTLNP